MIGHHSRFDKSRELESAVAIRCDHHSYLDALIAESRDAPGPFTFDHHSPFPLNTVS